MARQLTPLGIVVVNAFKWVVVPLIVGLIGFKLIGPMISPKAEKSSESKERSNQRSESSRKFQSVRNP